MPTGTDRSLSKSEQVFRELFPPRIGDYVEFRARYDRKHRKMRGTVKAIGKNMNGVPFYLIEISFVEPRLSPGSVSPKSVQVKGNSRLRILEKSETKGEEAFEL